MIRSNIQDRFYNHLGNFDPYYRFIDNELLTSNSFNEIADTFGGELELDIIAVSEILNNRFVLGDRTNIKDLKRRPWLSRWNSEEQGWEIGGIEKSVPKIF